MPPAPPSDSAAYLAVKKRWEEVGPDVDLGLLEKLKLAPVKVDYDVVNTFKEAWDVALILAVEFAEAGEVRVAEATQRAEKAEAEAAAAAQQLSELQGHVERFGAESQGADAELQALRQEIDEANQEVEVLREQVSAAQARGQQGTSSLSMELAKLRVDAKKEADGLRTQLAAANAAAQTNQNKLEAKAKADALSIQTLQGQLGTETKRCQQLEADALSIQTLQGQLGTETKRCQQLEADAAKSATGLRAELERLRRNEKQAEEAATEAAETWEAEAEKMEARIGVLELKSAAADSLFTAARDANKAAKERGAVTKAEVELDDAVGAYRAATAKK